MSESDPEAYVVSTFVKASVRERYRWLLSKPGKRSEAICRLAEGGTHLNDLLRIEVPPSLSTDQLIVWLRDQGADAECYILSDSTRLDRRRMAIGEAVRFVYGQLCSAVVLLSPRLLFLQGEGPNCRFLYARGASKKSTR